MSRRGESPVRHGIRRVLVLGLGLVLVLLLGLGIYAAMTLASVSRAGTVAARDFFHRSEQLTRVHALMNSTASNVRDYLLGRDEATAARHRDRARLLWGETSRALAEYRSDAGEARRALVDQLTADAGRYWSAAEEGLALGGTERARRGGTVLQERLSPLRERLSATFTEIGLRDRKQLRTEAAATAGFVQSAERRLGAVVMITAGLALLVAAATVLYLSRLENAAAAQYKASVKASVELERLSRRLLTLQEDERRRIAGELHDDFGQRMASVLFEIAAIAGHEQAGPEVRAGVQQVEERLRQVAGDLQQLSRRLHSAVLDKIGLEAAIRSDCGAIGKRTGWRLDCTSRDVPARVPESLSLALYRVFQEALQNALKHSGGEQLDVALVRDGADLVLRVRDFGRGFDPQSTGQGSLGLISMRERIGMVGGRLCIRSGSGEGTEIEARVALPVNGSGTGSFPR